MSLRGTLQLFVYYRVDAAHIGLLVPAISVMQAGLCKRLPGLRATLLRRPGVHDGQVTLMEAYSTDAEHRPRGVEAGLQAEIEASAAAAMATLPCAAPMRHIEIFEAFSAA